METPIIPSQFPSGLEITAPLGHDLPPQQPSRTYQSKPLPPLPPSRPGLSRQVSALSAAPRTTRSRSRSRGRTRATSSPPPPTGRKTIEKLEEEINTILIQQSPKRASKRLSEHRSCSPGPRRSIRDEETMKSLAPRRLSTPILSPTMFFTPITSPRTLHRSSVKIKQITGLDLDYKGFAKARKAAPPNTQRQGTPDKSSGTHETEAPPSTSEPARTLSMIEDNDDDSEYDSDWDYSPSSRRKHASWIPASPVPPRVEIFDFDEASPRRRDSEVGPLRSPGMHHFETLPARRNNHMEVSYVGAKDLYHATATSIANSTKKKTPPSMTSTDSGSESIMQPKNRLSFAAKVLQSGRKRPPMGINTSRQSTSSQGSNLSSGRLQAVTPAHSLDDDRLRVRYSDAFSRVFRRSGEHRRAVSEGTSPVDRASSEPRTVETPTTANTISTMSSGPGSPALAVTPGKPSKRSVQNLTAHVKRTASLMVHSKDNRRRDNLRQSIRVIPEGSTL
ncbi:uncharacterized protein CTRU02_205716 [Colletotrichum truncatum]|uniref:Uncharacterized protein n=1 Tax=Colletotrichum truncatum TaxID=5467 RepID=A0ACC3Z4T1_COLTU|nr:uncharacterized protein CTRU02_09468 [Colletotrichum truncatum]KAF6788660.1 hypothetical protein CTRU02_09468 [Colletotrichum truncatum]